MKILFINGSPNENGNTANLASILLNGKEYETLNLTNFTIGSYFQNNIHTHFCIRNLRIFQTGYSILPVPEKSVFPPWR